MLRFSDTFNYQTEKMNNKIVCFFASVFFHLTLITAIFIYHIVNIQYKPIFQHVVNLSLVFEKPELSNIDKLGPVNNHGEISDKEAKAGQKRQEYINFIPEQIDAKPSPIEHKASPPKTHSSVIAKGASNLELPVEKKSEKPFPKLNNSDKAKKIKTQAPPLEKQAPLAQQPATSVEAKKDPAPLEAPIRAINYEQLLSKHFRNNLLYSGGFVGTVYLEITIDNDGNLLDYKINSTKNYRPLIRQLKIMVKSSTPLPKPESNDPIQKYLVPISFSSSN